MSSKKAGVPNGSEPGVPNRSELAKTNATSDLLGGRPPVLTDEQLDALALELNSSLGRPPKIEELIAASGGCQRQRASRTIQRLREGLAAKSVQSMLVLAPELEGQMRQWIERLMSSAAKQLATEHARLIYEHDQNEAASKELIQEQQLVVSGLREQLADHQRITSELAAESQRLKLAVGQMTAERDIAQAVAADRLALLEKLNVGAAPAN